MFCLSLITIVRIMVDFVLRLYTRDNCRFVFTVLAVFAGDMSRRQRAVSTLLPPDTCVPRRELREYCFTSLSAQSWQYHDRGKPEVGTSDKWLLCFFNRAQYHGQYCTLWTVWSTVYAQSRWQTSDTAGIWATTEPNEPSGPVKSLIRNGVISGMGCQVRVRYMRRVWCAVVGGGVGGNGKYCKCSSGEWALDARWICFLSIFRHLQLELLTQFPASND